jgi:peptide chain release factor 1
MWDKLAEIERRFGELELEMAKPEVAADPARRASLSRDYAELEDLVRPYREALKLKQRLAQSKDELRSADDEELRALLRQDIDELTQELGRLEAELKALVAPKDPDDRKNCIVEIRAGAGGEEAALFASELLTMYTSFAQHRGWVAELVDVQETGLRGIKEAVLEVRGRGAYGWLRFESGVHRVQRVPVTESSGRIHTSTATVAVLPEVEGVEVEVKESDLRIDTYRSSSAGGQHVNKTSSAIRVTHAPTGLVVTCQDERSQLQNKEKALRVLKAKLYRLEQERQVGEVTEQRRSQVGSGDRAEKIRTYNFPDSRITDHRIGKKVHDLERFLGGEIEAMIEALRAHDEGERLSKLHSSTNH